MSLLFVGNLVPKSGCFLGWNVCLLTKAQNVPRDIAVYHRIPDFAIHQMVWDLPLPITITLRTGSCCIWKEKRGGPQYHSYLSIAVNRHHDQSILYKKALIWGFMVPEDWSP